MKTSTLLILGLAGAGLYFYFKNKASTAAAGSNSNSGLNGLLNEGESYLQQTGQALGLGNGGAPATTAGNANPSGATQDSPFGGIDNSAGDLGGDDAGGGEDDLLGD